MWGDTHDFWFVVIRLQVLLGKENLALVKGSTKALVSVPKIGVVTTIFLSIHRWFQSFAWLRIIGIMHSNDFH